MKNINKSVHLVLFHCSAPSPNPFWPLPHIQLITVLERTPVFLIGPPSASADTDPYMTSLFLLSIYYMLPSILHPSTNTQRTWRNSSHGMYIPAVGRDAAQVTAQKCSMRV